MKKHLLAAAVAAAVAAPVMAQNVTLYGTIDAGVTSWQKAGANGENVSAYVDGNLSSSVWGLRGSEDLGGGLRAIFQLESDIQTNNGGMNQNGLFRRAANVGIAGPMGTVEFGLKLNPVIATNGALMPLAGNAVSTQMATAMNYADFYNKNAITYTSPSINGLVIQGQYGFDNTVASATPGGKVWAGSAAWSAGALTFRAAMQQRDQNGSTSSANAGLTTTAAGNTMEASPEKRTVIAGLQYAMGPWAFGVAMMQNEYARTPNGVDNARIEINGSQYGVRYTMSPAVTLGASHSSSEGSSLTNFQARYTLSKRTTTYVNYGMVDNDANAPLRTPTTAATAARVQFTPVSPHTGNLPAGIISGAAARTGTQSALTLGVIHTF